MQLKRVIIFLTVIFQLNLSALPLFSQDQLLKENKKIILQQPQYTYRQHLESQAHAWIFLLEKVPWAWNVYQAIPKQFSLAKQKLILNSEELVLQNKWNGEPQKLKRSCLIYFDYLSWDNSTKSLLEVPVLNSSGKGLLMWQRVPLGYYTFRLRPGNYWQENRWTIRLESRF